VGRGQGRRDDEVELRHAPARRRLPPQAFRRVRRRALHDGQRPALPLVAGAHAGWPHQPLGPHLAALRPARFQGAQPRRPRRGLADRLRRHEAVLRQARRIRRALRHQRGPGERAGRHLPASAGAACLRAARPEGEQRPQDPVHPLAPLRAHEAAQRPAGLPLLRAVRPRMRDALELLEPVRAASARPGHRAPQDRDGGHGPRGDDRQRGARHRRLLRSAPRSSCWPPAPARRRGCS
jgi:hypothetical protein